MSSGGPNDAPSNVADHLKSALRAGVTTLLDLGSSQHTIFEYRKRLALGEISGPRLFARRGRF